MAVYKIIASADIEALSTWEYWDGTTWQPATLLPGASDDIYMNGFSPTTSILVTITYNSIRNTADVGMGINVGGTLNFNTDYVSIIFTITANLYQEQDNLIYFSAHRSGRIMIFIGNSYPGNAGVVIFSYSGGNAATHNLEIYGNIYGNINNLSYYFNYGGAGTPNLGAILVGECFAGGAAMFYQRAYSPTYSRTFSLTGSATASNLANCFILYPTSTVVSNITGNLYPSAYFPAIIYVTKLHFTNSNLYAVGTMNAFAYAHLQSLKVTGYLNWNVPSDDPSGYMTLSNNTDDLYPLEADVRSGTTYSAELKVGTCAVPPASTVNIGVPVDDTVGTNAFDGVMVERLKNCATTGMVGQIVASYNAAPVEIIPNAEKRHDFTGSTSFCGTAVWGTLESSPIWNLTRIVVSIDGSSISTTAEDSWNNRYVASHN